MSQYYKQPRYYSKFRCVGGDCPVSCCDGWQVFWSYNEVEHLKSAEMSDELRNKIEDRMLTKIDMPSQTDEKNDVKKNIFTASDISEAFSKLSDDEKLAQAKKNGYVIRMCEDGRCPFHNRETDLCDIQKQIGEEYFGVTCSIYPRRFRICGDVIVRSCTSSCPAVLKLILKDKRACELEMVPARDPDLVHMQIDVEKQWKEQPYLLQRVEILDFFNDLFRTGTQNATFEESVLLGALGAKAISQASRHGHAYEIPMIAADAKKKLKTREHIQWARELEPDVEKKLGLVNMIVQAFGKNTVDIKPFYSEDGKTVNTENYEKGKEIFEKAIPEHDKVFKALALNLFIDTFMFVDLQKYNFFEFYSYFAVCMASMQIAAYLAGLKNEDIENDFICNAANLSRGISHNASTAQLIVDALQKSDLIYPPQLAVIIK